MPISTQYITLAGGEDLVTPPDEIEPGQLLLGVNVYPDFNGGYTRFAGFERFDGRTAPSSYSSSTDQETARSAIQAVPGADSVLGVWIYNDVVYAFRNTATTGVKMFKSTASGWSEIAGAAATLANQDGHFEFVNHNFGGHSSTEKMYGCDGKNKAWEWDGTTFSAITTGMTTDTPEHLATYRQHLWLSFSGGSLQYSPLADPTGTWSVITGSGEIALGANITGIQPISFDTMAVFGQSKTAIIYGVPGAPAVSGFGLREYSDSVGAREWTIQRIGPIYYMDNRSITELSKAEVFGDFIGNSISRLIQPYVDQVRGDVCASAVDRKRGLYYLFTDVGRGIVGAFYEDQLLGFCRLQLGINVTCACSGEIAGEERVFVGADDGFVYELEKGTTFDGSAVNYTMALPYHHYGSPRRVKRFRRIVADCYAPSGTISFNVKPTWDFRSDKRYTHPVRAVSLTSGAAQWGSGQKWNDGTKWGGTPNAVAEIPVWGRGTHMAITISGNVSYEQPYTLRGIKAHISTRKLKRASF